MISDYSTAPYGKELATKVANQLVRYTTLSYSHRDYCGTGFYFQNPNFFYGYFYDGIEAETIKSFSSKEEFINWLSVQSDWSMSGEEEVNSFYQYNQRITKKRLEEYIAI